MSVTLYQPLCLVTSSNRNKPATTTNNQLAPPPTNLIINKDWPNVLPELAWPPKALKEDYGLHTIMPDYASKADVPLSKELKAFKAWCKAPMDISRGLTYSSPVKEITFEGCQETIMCMMGCCFKVIGMMLCTRSCIICMTLHPRSIGLVGMCPLLYLMPCFYLFGCLLLLKWWIG